MHASGMLHEIGTESNRSGDLKRLLLKIDTLVAQKKTAWSIEAYPFKQLQESMVSKGECAVINTPSMREIIPCQLPNVASARVEARSSNTTSGIP